MQKDESHDAHLDALPESPSDYDVFSSTFQPSARMRERLWDLATWRIDPSSIQFPNDSYEVKGGNATVSRAFLASPSGSTDSTNRSDPTENTSLDAGRSAGETSQGPKAVAVKKMKMSGDIARVVGLTVREAEFLVGLSHENIIELEGFVEDISKDIVWLVFPWEENGTLRDFIASAEWEIPERISLINDVVRGVEYLHSRRPPVCHGDLKSLNVLVNSKFRAVITDFGSARHLKPEDLNKETKPAQKRPPAALSLEATFCASTNTITLTGDHYTLRWAAPELLYEEGPSGLYSDIWALGWVAYEVMTGFIPFHNVRDTVVIVRVIRGNLPSITGDARISLVQMLCSLMLMCWSIDPSKRPTAEDCRKSIHWMPMAIPNHMRASDTAASVARSPELLLKLGVMHVQQGDYPNALDFFTKAVNGYTSNDDMEGKATALIQLGQVHRFLDDNDRAVPFYSEALEIYTNVDNRQGRASALWGLAEVHRARNEYSEAIAFYSEALQIRTDVGDTQGRASALVGLAGVHRARKEYSQAITFYSEDLQIRTTVGDRLGKAQSLLGLGEVHRLQNEFSQAAQLFSEALQISTDIGDRFTRTLCVLRLAKVHRDQKRYSDAIRLFTEAAEVFEEIGNARNAAFASNQAAGLRKLSDGDEAP